MGGWLVVVGRWKGPILLSALALAAACSPVVEEVGDPSSRSAAPLNLLIVSIDTLRADRLGCYGNEGGHTPSIDRLAASAIVFENALSPIATTFPSHATMFTGYYPRAHGLRWNGDGLSADRTTLAELLKEAGYATGAFVSFKSMVNRGGLGQGFDSVSDPRPGGHAHATRPGTEVNAQALAWLAEHQGRGGSDPFFLWVHYFEAHAPYTPNEYSKLRLADYAGIFKDGATPEAFRAFEEQREKSSDDVRALNLLYDGSVRNADDRLGEVLDYLERNDLRSSTIVVLVSDHGEMMGEHDEVGHGPLLWEPVLHVPLLLADPRREPGRRAGRVGLVDVTPTLLDLLSLPVPDRLQGESLVAMLDGEPTDARRYYAEVRLPPPDQETTGRWYESVAVYEGRYKLVLGEDDPRLFDLVADPVEGQGVEAEAPEVFDALHQLARSHQGSGSGRRDEEIDDAVLEELRALGYVR